MFPLLIDANNLTKRAIMASALDDLKAGETWTGGVYGTIASLTSLMSFLAVQDSLPTVVIAVYDDGVPAFRKTAIPGYKEGRKERFKALTEEQVEKCFQQVPLCRQALELLGCVIVDRKGWEADDLLGAYARAGLTTKTPMLIASSDKDLWQCVSNPRCALWDLGKKLFIDSDTYEERFAEVFEVPPIPLAWFSVFRAILGDSSDDVPGVKGVGPVGASEAIRSVPHASDIVSIADQISALHLALGENPEKKKMQALKAGLGYVRKIAEVNALVVPRSGLPLSEFTMFPTSPGVDRKKFLQFCAKLKFKSVLGDPDKYMRHLAHLGE